MAKNKVGPVQVFLDRNSLNAMLCCLDYLITASDGEWNTFASRLKAKIMKHSRAFKNQEADCAAIYFYENEAAVLIKAFSLFVFLTRNPSKDYYDMIQRSDSDANENV